MDDIELRTLLLTARSNFDADPSTVSDLETVRRLFDANPLNADIQAVRRKVRTIDSRYKTFLGFSNSAEGEAVERLARWIAENHARLDPLLSRGDPQAVYSLSSGHPIRTLRGRQKIFWSFATKYAHFTNPAGYAIWDSRADKSIRVAESVLHFEGGISYLDADDTAGWYERWLRCVDRIRLLMDVSDYREADKALYWWGGE